MSSDPLAVEALVGRCDPCGDSLGFEHDREVGEPPALELRMARDVEVLALFQMLTRTERSRQLVNAAREVLDVGVDENGHDWQIGLDARLYRAGGHPGASSRLRHPARSARVVS